jgi:hypothetical protein
MSGTEAILKRHEPAMKETPMKAVLWVLSLVVTALGFLLALGIQDFKALTKQVASMDVAVAAIQAAAIPGSRVTADQLNLKVSEFDNKLMRQSIDVNEKVGLALGGIEKQLQALRDGQNAAAATRDEIRMQFNQVEREAQVARSLAERLQVRVDAFEVRIQSHPDINVPARP